jgi:hypothetical protein
MNGPGRKPSINDQLQKKIIRLIHSLEVTETKISWDLLKDEIKRSYKLNITRQTLATNSKIVDAFRGAKEYQLSLKRQKLDLPFKTLPRDALRTKVAEMQARIDALEAELSLVRSQQYDQLSAFLTSRLSLENLEKLKNSVK